MPFPSIESRIEDAVHLAFLEFDDPPTGFSYFKSNAAGELSVPAIVIECPSFEKLEPDAEQSARCNLQARVLVHVMTHSTDSDRTAHANLVGWAQAMGMRSADQMVGLMNTSGVANLTALAWGIEASADNTFDEQLRVTTMSFSLICFAP